MTRPEQSDAPGAIFVVFAGNGNVRLWSTEREQAERFAQSVGATVTPMVAAVECDRLKAGRDELLEALETLAENVDSTSALLVARALIAKVRATGAPAAAAQAKDKGE